MALTNTDKLNDFGLKGDLHLVAVIDAEGFKFIEGESAKTLWKGKGSWVTCLPSCHFYLMASLAGGVPYDGAFVSEIHPNSPVLQGVYYGLASGGCLYALALAISNYVWFNKR